MSCCDVHLSHQVKSTLSLYVISRCRVVVFTWLTSSITHCTRLPTLHEQYIKAGIINILLHCINFGYPRKYCTRIPSCCVSWFNMEFLVYICVLDVLILPLYTIFLFDLEIFRLCVCFFLLISFSSKTLEGDLYRDIIISFLVPCI